ncbi:MAG: galactose mutarotase [Lachnospiraceae bacterium]|nr:galactose mutarotase [Lachnospiraceae bacterium]
MNRELFGKTTDGKEIYKYWLENSKGMKAGVINFGAILVNLLVPDKDGNTADVVLGYDTLEEYVEKGNFFGATVGPNANRIGGASFELEGKRYQLDVNDGENNLHSHLTQGYHMRVWEAEQDKESVTFFLEDADGNMGFPGNKKIWVTYTLTEDNELKIHYQVKSDKNTIVNMTNHSYFNLAGHDQGAVYDHVLKLKASHYTPIVMGAIPTGEIAKVAGTPFDFTEAKRVGDEIDADNEQLKMTNGYDHNWVIDGADGTLQKFADLTDPASGRHMEAFTDLPGVQVYAGNGMSRQTGKGNAVYDFRGGICLETQYYPDTANKPEFPSAVFGPDREYDSTTIYKFS